MFFYIILSVVPRNVFVTLCTSFEDLPLLDKTTFDYYISTNQKTNKQKQTKALPIKGQESFLVKGSSPE